MLKPDPERRIGWRARYTDPDSGRTVKQSLDAQLSTTELREDWAVRKAKALARRRFELEGGAQRTTGTALEAALKRYFEDHEHLRPKTLEVYRAAADKLTAWAAKTGLRSADDLTGPRLVAFRAEVIKERRRTRELGGKRGAMKATTETRSPYTINRELRSVSTVLTYCRRLGLLPRLTADELADGLKKLSTGTHRIDYRKPHELQKLLEAALRHDADTFTATREEHAGKRPLGTTPKHVAIAPFVAAALLTGMRLGELIDLGWDQVDLEALDNDGKVVGEIYITAESKTHRARTVGLEVSPALRKLLAALHMKTGGRGSVFGLTRGEAHAAERRLRADYGAPAGCNWQALRRTCGTFLTNAGGIFGASSAYRSAKQLGHSVQVAERHYIDVARGIPREARTLEAAMMIEDQMKAVIAAVGARPAVARAKAG